MGASKPRKIVFPVGVTPKLLSQVPIGAKSGTGTVVVVLLTFSLALALSRCTTTKAPVTPPAPANPPQVQVLGYARLASAAVNTATDALVSLCVPKPPVIDLGTCNVVKADLQTIVGVIGQVTIEANRVPDLELWATARVNIAAIAAKAVIHSTVKDLGLQADLNSLVGLIQNIVGVQ